MKTFWTVIGVLALLFCGAVGVGTVVAEVKGYDGVVDWMSSWSIFNKDKTAEDEVVDGTLDEIESETSEDTTTEDETNSETDETTSEE